jgi:NDP-sugar pyrophosphorylase family protein
MSRGRCLRDIDVVVLAGGLGLRLRDAIGPLPKVLAPIAGRPFLDYLLAWLEGFGARRVVLSLGYQAEMVLAYLAARPPSALVLVPVVEPAPLGTAGALRFVRGLLGSDPVMVLNGDSLVDADLSLLLAAHARAGTALSMLCTEVPGCGRYGRVELTRDQRVERFVEKDESFAAPGLINAGIYVVSAGLLDTIALGTASSFERDVLAAAPPHTIQALAGRFPFIDIGTSESLNEAVDFLPKTVSIADAPPSGRSP